jgi:tetratricopeptide (TPR) repeat protein
LPKLTTNLGLIQLNAGDLHAAETEFSEAVRLKPNYAEAHYNLGLALHQNGKEVESNAEFEISLRHFPRLEKSAAPRKGARFRNLLREPCSSLTPYIFIYWYSLPRLEFPQARLDQSALIFQMQRDT